MAVEPTYNDDGRSDAYGRFRIRADEAHDGRTTFVERGADDDRDPGSYDDLLGLTSDPDDRETGILDCGSGWDGLLSA
jgi:hypothetical protein